MKKVLLVLVVGISLVSCQASKEFVRHISKKENIDAPQTKTIIVIAADNVTLNEFKKTYKKNYEDNNAFTRAYLEQLTEGLKLRNIYADVIMDSTALNYEDVNTNNIDYVVRLSNFGINNRVEWTHGGMGVNGMHSSTSIEYCIIKTKVEVYDAKTNKEILDFVAFGEESVFLFDFTKTFLKAKDNSVLHIINYLESGKILYKQSQF